MTKVFSILQRFSFLLVLVLSMACNEARNTDVPQEMVHPKLIKTIGAPNYGSVGCSLEDKEGNLWFGGDSGGGLNLYDGTSFTRFTTEDGLIHNHIWSILEDKAGNLWIGTRETGLSRYDGKTFTTYSEYKPETPKN